jgi:hypothetical protein
MSHVSKMTFLLYIAVLMLASLACGMTYARPLPAALAAPVPEKVEFTDNYGVYYVTAIQSLTVRNRASLDGTAIAWLVNGQEVTIYSCHWNYVDRVEWCDIGTGWVARRYLEAE